MITTHQPKRSMLRKRSVPKFENNLKIIPPQPPNIIDRDYGLMRIPGHQASTQHPNKTLGLPSYPSEDRAEAAYNSTINFDNKALKKSHLTPREHMMIGTPHPNKALALDPKILIKDYEAVKERMSLRNAGNELCCNRQPYSILKKNLQHGKHDKKVTIRLPSVGCFIPSTSSSSDDSKLDSLQEVNAISPPTPIKSQNLSFLERRRLFHEGEFTIAKYGKRMNERVMHIPKRTIVNVESEHIRNDKQAKNDIEKYIINHGFRLTHCALSKAVYIIQK